MDATGTERAVARLRSPAAPLRALLLAAGHPERVAGVVVHRSGAFHSLPARPARMRCTRSQERLDTDEGWAKYNSNYWLENYEDFLEFFFAQVFSEPHSTKQIEDWVGWGLEMSTRDAWIARTHARARGPSRRLPVTSVRRVRCPVLVLHGDAGRDSRPLAQGAALAEATGGTLVTLEGSGHCPHVRDPVKVNLLMRDFVESLGRRTS